MNRALIFGGRTQPREIKEKIKICKFFLMPHQIQNREVQHKNLGHLECPYLFAITSGQRNLASLIFHIKIGSKFHQCHIRKVNKNSVNIRCCDRRCRSHHNLKMNPKFLLSRRDPGRTNYNIDYSNLELRNLENWVVIKHETRPHTEQCETDFSVHLAKIFREEHSNLALKTGKNQHTESVLQSWNLQYQDCPGFEAKILKSKKNQENSARQKLKRKKEA